ncbi:hypothetical protein BGZ90_001882 [Linnemannia elongata]|nr:hypothetical protein BGZ90_001882 [Linnemannia elongata]
MNHETKEVILKVTDVVKTVVHFGFIPFVIYLGFTRYGRTGRFARYQQDTETFSWASDERLSLEDKEKEVLKKEAPSEGNGGTICVSISGEAIASLDAVDVEMKRQLIEYVRLAGHDPIYSYHHHRNNDNIKREESVGESEVASATITKSNPERSESTLATLPSEDNENAFPLFGPQDIAGPSAIHLRPIPRPPPSPPPGLPFDFELGLNLPRRRQRPGFYNDPLNRPTPKKYAPLVIRDNSTPVVRIQDTPTSYQSSWESTFQLGKLASAVPATSIKAESELATATPPETKQKTPTELSTLVEELAPNNISSHKAGTNENAPDISVDGHLGISSQHICLDLETSANAEGTIVIVVDLDHPCDNHQEKLDNSYGRASQKTTTDFGDSGERRTIRILDDFVIYNIYNKNKSRPGYGFRFSDLEKCLDRCCEIRVSGKVRPALFKHGQVFGRKKLQLVEAGTHGKGSTIHLSNVLGWGMDMVDNGESYLWIKTQFATYILDSPASMYGPVYDNLFKKTRLTNLLMVALIADRDATLDNFVSNMR